MSPNIALLVLVIVLLFCVVLLAYLSLVAPKSPTASESYNHEIDLAEIITAKDIASTKAFIEKTQVAYARQFMSRLAYLEDGVAKANHLYSSLTFTLSLTGIVLGLLSLGIAFG